MVVVWCGGVVWWCGVVVMLVISDDIYCTNVLILGGLKLIWSLLKSSVAVKQAHGVGSK